MRLYHVRDRLTNEYQKNEEGKNLEVSEITKKTYDMLKKEFDLLGNVVLEEVPEASDKNLITTYGGGTNAGD